jgi:hypothetical protein
LLTEAGFERRLSSSGANPTISEVGTTTPALR